MKEKRSCEWNNCLADARVEVWAWSIPACASCPCRARPVRDQHRSAGLTEGGRTPAGKLNYLVLSLRVATVSSHFDNIWCCPALGVMSSHSDKNENPLDRQTQFFDVVLLWHAPFFFIGQLVLR